MHPDDIDEVWRHAAPKRLTIDSNLLLQEVRRNQSTFTTMLFWRDIREIIVSLILIPVWIGLGVGIRLPWTWYLTLPALFWILGFMFVDLRRQRRQLAEPSESLRRGIESSLTQVNHQIWLLENVKWWCMLPIAVSTTAFFLQVAWNVRGMGWFAVLHLAFNLVFCSVVLRWVHRLNQNAVATVLIPRRQELEALLTGLDDEPAQPVGQKS
jgi:hypothetical protein